MRILSIVGARPQFVKAAVFREYCLENGVDEILMHTGQHYAPEMSTNIFRELGVKQPDISHALTARSHGGMTGELIAEIERQIIDLKPDFVNVYGDTNSTLAGALAASKLKCPVIHIEAGLRSFNKQMPEEVNRILTDHVSKYLFCPTFEAVKNLNEENIKTGVHHVGDIMFDAIEKFKDKFKSPCSIGIPLDRELAVLTIHRAETIYEPNHLKQIIEYCKDFTNKFEVVFPAHPNTRSKLTEYGIGIGNIKIIKPISYLEMQGMLREASVVLTDSGGIQKEAYYHGCDCITLRNETEWPETIEAGWNRLYAVPPTSMEKKEIMEYGDGQSVAKIIKIIR